MKVVINKCFGGFGLSVLALKMLHQRGAKCMESYTPKHYYGGDSPILRRDDWQAGWDKDRAEYTDIGDGYLGHKHGYNILKDDMLHDIVSGQEVRTDPDLIAVVEELGDKANSWAAALAVVEIPDGIEWEIDEYDGSEHIAEKHRTWG